MPQNSDNDQAFLIGSFTDPGRSGKNNEDALAVFEVDWQDDLKLRRVQVAVVADGIGGNNAGEVASKIAVDKVQVAMRSQPTIPLPERMEQAVQTANQAVFNTGQNSTDLLGMGSTLVMAAIADDDLYVAHVGDSRAYLVRGGVAHRLTLDHTWAQEAIDIGRLTPEEASRHPNRNVIKRFLGVDETLAVDQQIIDLAQAPGEVAGPGRWPMVDRMRVQPGDTVLLCSDGLTDELSDAELQAVVRKAEPQAAAEQLVAQANAHGGRDNITVVLVRVPGGPATPRAAAALPVAGGKSRLPLLLGVLAGLALVAALVAFLLLRPGEEPSAAPPPTVPAAGDSATADAATSAAALVAPAVDTATATPTVPALAPTAAEFVTTTLAGAVGDATSTPLPTRTPSPIPPTPTPQPTVRFSPTQPGAATSPAASPAAATGAVTVALLEPNEGDTRQRDATFRWSVTGSLPAGQAFEVFFYKAGDDPLRGFGLAAPTTDNSVQVNLAALDENPNLPLDPGTYLWGVRLVQQATGAAVRVLAEGRQINYERQPQQVQPTSPTATPGCVGDLCP